MEDLLAAKRARFLSLAEELPGRCRLIETSAGNGLLRKLRKLALFRGRYVRWAAARAGLKPGIVELPLFWGGAMTLPYSDEADFVTFYLAGAPGGPEYKLVRYFIRTLAEDDSFYDAGANYGFYTMLAAEFIGARGEIHAFEPMPGIHTRLLLNAPAGVKVVDAALWDRTGTATLYRHPLGDVFNTLEAAVAENDPAGVERAKTEVRCTTLDDYAKARRAPTVIKIDIEGGEQKLIAGGLETLHAARPRIAMEVWARAAGERFSLPACKALLDLGYAAQALNEDGTTRALDAAALPGFIRDMPAAWDNVVFLPV